jgi:hypothetical protein
MGLVCVDVINLTTYFTISCYMGCLYKLHFRVKADKAAKSPEVEFKTVLRADSGLSLVELSIWFFLYS